MTWRIKYADGIVPTKRVCPYHPTEQTGFTQLRCERCGRTLYNQGPRAQEAQKDIEARRRASRGLS